MADTAHRWWWIRQAIRHHCRVEEDWCLTRVQRMFYTVKAIVALVAGRAAPTSWRDHRIEVASSTAGWVYSLDAVGAMEWRSLMVPKGLRGWTYDLYDNANY